MGIERERMKQRSQPMPRSPKSKAPPASINAEPQLCTFTLSTIRESVSSTNRSFLREKRRKSAVWSALGRHISVHVLARTPTFLSSLVARFSYISWYSAVSWCDKSGNFLFDSVGCLERSSRSTTYEDISSAILVQTWLINVWCL